MLTNNYTISAKEMPNISGTVIKLIGELTIENSVPIHSFLSKHITENNDITINIEESDNIDLSVIQLIIGFINDRNKQKTITQLEINLNEDIMELLNKSGTTALIASLQKEN